MLPATIVLLSAETVKSGTPACIPEVLGFSWLLSVGLKLCHDQVFKLLSAQSDCWPRSCTHSHCLALAVVASAAIVMAVAMVAMTFW